MITEAEVSALVALARSRGAQTAAIGSGRDPLAHESMRAIAEAWERAGGEMARELTWPETAASWLRQATRFAAAEADLWIMHGPPLGWAQMTRRLLWSTPWQPAHTLLTGAVSDRRTLDLVGRHNLPGISGVTRDGDTWQLGPDDHGGASRLAYHGVTRVHPFTAPDGCGLDSGRINITMRMTGLTD
ncbi:hypothetical protein ACIHCX_35680 [Streptomyces sp. NPDC052043]|uniref:hypothetical protein n=1 Tax=Streptomyces sp. NPDC052043 TaxID=3365684 RepID=UPI0037CD09CA